MRTSNFLSLLAFSFALVACGGGSGSSTGASLGLTLGSSMVLAPQDGTPGQDTIIISGTSSSVSLSVSNTPAGITPQFSSIDATGHATLTLVASPAVPSGTYALTVSAASGTNSAAQPLTLVVAVSAVVANSTDTSLGINGQLQQFMSTSFQPAEWDYPFFELHPGIEPAQLNALGPQHIRIQGISQAIPWIANSNPQQPTDWDFTDLDAIVQPILSVTDHSPEFQVAVAPNLPGLLDANGNLIVNDANLQTFASYAANLVRYYNTGGFTWGGQLFASPSPHHITWWGIFNEYNINGLTPAQYVQLYDTVVPAMLAVDPTIQFSALELSDYDYQEGDPRNNLPTFVAPVNAGGVSAQVNVASTHFYSSCDQTDSDTQIFSTIPGFVADVQYFRQQFAARPDLANVPVWVTENNVNADYADANGNSTCNPGQKFVLDKRGTSPFFAAWRPYLFSQLGKAGNQALYHWDYGADAQYSEVDYTSGNKYLSYWVDYILGQLFPVTAASSPAILSVAATETFAVEILATKNPDGTFVVMITDRAVHSSADNNGSGDPRTVVIDVSALGNYASVSQTTLDATTSLTGGPTSVTLTPAPKLSVNLGGYGTAFIHIKP
jgi:hypothetical protein